MDTELALMYEYAQSKPQDSFGEFDKFFQKSSESAGNHQKNTIRPSCNCFEWHIYCNAILPNGKLSLCTYNLWQSVRGDSEHFHVFIIS